MGRTRDFDAGDVSGSDCDASLDNGEHGQKRARTSVVSSHDQDPDGLRHPQKIRATTGRVAAKDYEVAVREILKVAIGRFRSRLTAENAYPDRIEQVKWAKEAWAEGCKVCDTQINFNNEIIQLITNRTWHLTSELKTKIRPLTEAIYGFESSTKRAVQANNRKLVEDLVEDFGLCYRNNIPRSGLYENKIIQKAINISFYKNKRDEGVLYPEYFQPFPMAGVALILTVVEACIDEWSSGDRNDIPFNEPTFRPVYQNHLNQLRKFAALTKDHEIMPKLLSHLDNNGR
ncbi:hypothetical protein L210DRAFT_3430169 [Boletus edulis BED1]|uniref:DUF6532 domain-containing protein n=1 Tax=Boletus edulis BED1 TaxID=1328754 RepID=A0AAD4BBF3_BOLED|nr:hypothetical protein L210DRAFT_3430169 [Boletus edulis BED1]